MAQSPVPIGEIFANKYRVERVLGEGGMGVVVAAHHLELDQPVAVKFLLEDVAQHEEGAERFRREARAAAKIHSDHVVRVLDVGVMDDGVRYMVMEYLEGRDLSEELAERKSFPVGVAAGFILEAIDAVGQAHAVGIVHRDLKPANLFLAHRPDGSRRIKVLDFGISKTVGGVSTEQLSLTKTSAWIGSPLYMAPEQMQSARDVDARADIWSLGAILYELISGQPPYMADSLPQLCSMLLTREPEPIQNKCPGMPEGLANVIMRCLVRDREARIQSTTELARGLVQYATTITGSSVRSSLLDFTEFQSGSVPGSAKGSMPASVYSMPQRSITSSADSGATSRAAVGAATELSPPTLDGGTHAAWGGTDSGQRKSGGKIVLLAVALALAGAAGFFFASRGGSPESAAEPLIEQSPVTSTETTKSGEPSGKDPVQVEERLDAAPHTESDAGTPRAPATQPGTAQLPSSVTPSVVSSAPAAGPAPRPKPLQAPLETPRPAKAPAPAAGVPQDDFADFGGRR